MKVFGFYTKQKVIELLKLCKKIMTVFGFYTKQKGHECTCLMHL